ncbi:cobyrinate a,c-diamide synthase [Streptomyces johnsoniae]|uniref:Hydrogenobyrinate a,c-diamide synthase n=1 Tax=Streptomyces johnsoniae TaxID=3075532 RepID=A0ABU2S910_9ACTN|nr:cobyrinate a,c-diamide synthase [Streptomyces sp. DSM 41886]MDT0444284.1 cobyrinate a,c-diamide synthase [Streptomyces sp. DSM 41886]
MSGETGVRLPRLMVAAPASGQGKTTVATGLMAALRAAGHEVSGHKAGPDYIDPGYHALATGRPGRNLDPHLVGERRVAPLLLHGAAGADIAVIEGVMGLHDGRLGTDGFASSAHVATLTRTPVVLVMDVAGQSRSVGAVAAGMAAYDPGVHVAGVVLNRAGSARNTAEIERSLERAGLPVLGVVPRDDRLSAPSRHLGLVPAAERDDPARLIARLGERLARYLDLDALLAAARAAPDLGTEEPWEPGREVVAAGDRRPVVAVAGGRAFTFRYAETEELLTAAGCAVVTFDPLTDTELPAGTRGIYLGGGFPEVYAADLAANGALLHDLRTAVRRGIPTVAECAGLLYLAASLDGAEMAGVLPTATAMTDRLTLRYAVATAAADSLVTRAGERVTGHEFHRTQATPAAGTVPAWRIDGEATGFASATCHASYLHVHWAGHPRLAQRFADAVHAAAPHAAARHVTPRPAAVPHAPSEPVPDPLRHHGDRETGPGLIDFAVNVYDGGRPEWLDRALRRSLDRVADYPDPAPARAAVAERHGRHGDEVLPTAGAAEAFTLVARLRDWQRPVVVHPQFTEPHAALEQAGHHVTPVLCRPDRGFRLDPADVPEEADLVVIGNPTNPTGVLHPAEVVRGLRRAWRLVVVDEAFMDAVPGERESLAGERLAGVAVIRSLTKHWSIPGVRAGYVVADPGVIRELAAHQPPWSVSTTAVDATVAACSAAAASEGRDRARALVRWRDYLADGLRERGFEVIASSAPFVLARLGDGTHPLLRARGIAVRRADTFPGLGSDWVRVAARPPERTRRLFAALDAPLPPPVAAVAAP